MSVERYFQSGLAPSTQNCYDSAKRRFLLFCNRTGLSPLPLNKNVLCRYVASLADEGLSPKTIKSYLSATRHLQIAMSLPDPRMGEMARLEQVIKGAKREYAKRNPETRVRLPITPDILLKLRSVWSRDAKDFDRIMLWAACCLCFYGFLRAGEITVPSEAGYDSSVHLNMGDISVDNADNPTVVKEKIKASKSDQFRKGVDIFVGRTYNQLCPVEALMAYVAVQGQDDGLFFHFKDDRLLTKGRFVTSVREALSAAGIDAKKFAGQFPNRSRHYCCQERHLCREDSNIRPMGKLSLPLVYKTIQRGTVICVKSIKF